MSSFNFIFEDEVSTGDEFNQKCNDTPTQIPNYLGALLRQREAAHSPFVWQGNQICKIRKKYGTLDKQC